jgi:hypothetical protein
LEHFAISAAPFRLPRSTHGSRPDRSIGAATTPARESQPPAIKWVQGSGVRFVSRVDRQIVEHAVPLIAVEEHGNRAAALRARAVVKAQAPEPARAPVGCGRHEVEIIRARRVPGAVLRPQKRRDASKGRTNLKLVGCARQVDCTLTDDDLRLTPSRRRPRTASRRRRAQS